MPHKQKTQYTPLFNRQHLKWVFFTNYSGVYVFSIFKFRVMNIGIFDKHDRYKACATVFYATSPCDLSLSLVQVQSECQRYILNPHHKSS